MVVIGPGAEPFFTDVVDHMADICRADLAIVALANPLRQWISGLDDGRGGEAPSGLGFFACEVLGRGQRAVADVRTLPARPGIVLKDHAGDAIGAFLSHAVVADGVDIGNLYLVSREPREWSAFDLRYLDRAARLIANHVEARAALAERGRSLEVERELGRQSALYQAVVSAMKEGVVVQEASTGAVLASNAAACDILGLSEDQLHGRADMDPRWMMIDEHGEMLPGSLHPARVALATGAAVSDVLVGVALPDGEQRWMRMNAAPIFADGAREPDRVVATFVDVTEKRRTISELATALQRAEEASIAKQQFIANISHEIRTPLNGVLGMAQVMRAKPASPEQVQQIDVILDCGRSLMTLLNDTLDMSKIEAGLFEISPTEEDLELTIRKAVQLWESRAELSGLELSLAVSSSATGRLRFDAVRVQQCVSNLISNAVKFTQAGSVRVSAYGEAAADGRFMVSVAVEDTGIGMEPEAISRLFQPFQQADSSIARRFGGTGLGLSLVKRLAELMDGSVSVESEPGQGSRFVFSFAAGRVTAADDAGPVDAGPDDAGQAAPVAGEDGVRGLRVLAVDDNRVNRMVVQIFLKRHGVTVTEAANGQEALDQLGRGTFDAVLMDLHMPEMDGLQATATIRSADAAWSGLPVIALTADTLAGDRERLLEAGFDDWLPKPVVERDLVAALDGVRSGAGIRRQASVAA
jgi:PAS domain S-box-containing protein